ncbi:MAG: hypothetical protein EAS48_05050 [Chryseobacterium sp.]|nr:MAG: hypothetical protein EAS48_05050 [Chryseobacterium sp.]
MQAILDRLRTQIHEHPRIKGSSLGSATVWKRAQYVILADIINDDLQNSVHLQGERRFTLGTSISFITLQRFFEHRTETDTQHDLRFLKTLDKLAIFLGYKDLNDFIFKLDAPNGSVTVTAEKSTAEQFFDIVRGYCEADFALLKVLPEVEYSSVLKYVYDNSPLFERVLHYYGTLVKKNLLLNTVNNRSNYELFDFQLIADEPTIKIISTREFWNLSYYQRDTHEKFLYQKMNTQTYFIKNIGDKWKIWDNYNPNAGDLIKDVITLL